MDKLIFLLSMLTCFIATSFSYALFPYISRKTLSFGITIPEDMYHHEKVKAIRKNYLILILLSGLLFAAIMVFLVYSPFIKNSALVVAQVFTILLTLVVDGLIYIAAHKKMKVLKKENNWGETTSQLVTVNTDFRKEKITVSPLWFIAYLVILAATVMISMTMYNSLPEKIPMRFSFSGEVVSWVQKSYKALLIMPLSQLFITIIFIFAYYMIGKSKQQIDPANPEKTLIQNISYRYRWSIFLVMCGLLVSLMIGSIQLTILGVLPQMFVIIFSSIIPIAIIICALVLMVMYGQSGNRIKVQESVPKKVGAKDDDSYWKLGAFYYNPNDPSTFVEKRFGVGWTLNWARPVAWVVIIGILLLAVAFTIVTVKLGQ